jgi:hypothetical protein
MWIGLLNPDYSAFAYLFFPGNRFPLVHTSVLLVLGQEIASMQIWLPSRRCGSWCVWLKKGLKKGIH